MLLNKSNLNTAGKIYRKLVNIRKIIYNQKNIFDFLKKQKKQLETDYSIKIDYLELRKKKDLKLAIKDNNSRLFIAYYLNKVRLIDNL